MKKTQADLSFCKNSVRRYFVLPAVICFLNTRQGLWASLCCGLFIALLSPPLYAQTDTLTVRGKVENLSVRLYRQAPEITVARVNILQANREIVRAAQLQPDGSFELKMPLVYPLEECYLTYANLVMPFLGEKGTITVTINGDSLTKSDIPLRFEGVHAATNNRHAQFYADFNKWLKANPEKPVKAANPMLFWEKASAERQRKLDFYRSYPKGKDALLDQWVTSSLNEAAKAQLYAFLTQQPQTLPVALAAAAQLDTNRFFTFAKADSYRQFTNYALATTPNLPESSLPVNTLARLILQYVPHISPSDSLKLAGYVQGETAKMRELKWLSNLFNRKEDTLRMIAAYELFTRKFGAAHSAKELDYLKGAFYAENIHNFSLKNLTLWYNHLRPSLQNPYYGRSLDELHHIESLDSAVIRTAESKIATATVDDPLEIMPGIWLADTPSYSNETMLWNQLKRKFKGKIVYFLFWTNDDWGRRALAEANALRASLPPNSVEFVYISEYKTNDAVWREAAIKSRSKGLHLKVDESQNDYFVAEWAITQVPYAVLMDANGKYIRRDAPLPADREGWNKIWNKVFN